MGVGMAAGGEVTRGCPRSGDHATPVPTGFTWLPLTSNYNVKALPARRDYPGFPSVFVRAEAPSTQAGAFRFGRIPEIVTELTLAQRVPLARSINHPAKKSPPPII